MSYTPYVEFATGDYKGHHITRVGCLLCNDTIGSKDPLTNDLYYWNHKRDMPVVLLDGSKALIPVCDKCENTELTDSLMDQLSNTLKHGWLKEQTWALKQYPQRTTKYVVATGKWAKNIFVVSRSA